MLHLANGFISGGDPVAIMPSHNLKEVACILVGALVLVCSLTEIDATLNVGGACHAGFATCKNGRSCQTVLYSDVDNCGRCGVKCPPAPHSLRKCEKGRCDICCTDKEWRNCDGKNTNGCETNVHVNLNHCGKCGNVCTAPQNATATCSRGICGFECAKGFQQSQNKCSPEQHINTVGSCGSTRQVCPNWPNSDATCSGAGTCGFTCHAGFENCDENPINGCETDLWIDASNCGACNSTCSASQSCSNSSCVCNPGFANCDGNPINGCETDLRIDGFNCGACNSTCSASQSCSNSACVCNPGFGNCDGNPTNGCETDLRTDMNNCGACNASCVVVDNVEASTSTCSNSTCSVQCTDSSYGNCDGIVSNGCEVFFSDYNNCGSCGNSCVLPHGYLYCASPESGPLNFWCEQGYLVCDPGWMNCDYNYQNGCEFASNSTACWL